MKPWTWAIAAAWLAGCSTAPRVDTGFHELALYDRQPAAQRAALELPFDAYVIGIEKGPRERVGALPTCPPAGAGAPCLAFDAPFFQQRPVLRRWLVERYERQSRLTYVSHVARFDGGGAPCFLFNRHDAARPCDGRPLPTPEPAAVAQSWQVLDRLGDDLAATVQRLRPSHIVVYTMGWNTLQLEALDNFRDLAGKLRGSAAEAGDAAFRPLVLGVTWPSTGQPLIAASDYGIKAGDADEVGAVWINLLLHRQLRRLQASGPGAPKVVVVGHSFGARATSRAVFSAPLVGADGPPVVDLLLGLQGAYSFQRYLDAEDGQGRDGTEGLPYRDFARQAGAVALTSSVHDKAVSDIAHDGYFVGSATVFRKTQQPPFAARFAHVAAEASGRLPPGACERGRVLMIDASAVIKDNKPGTGGGAHSGIYTDEVGRLSYALIKACAG